jgi:hypothetical protein
MRYAILLLILSPLNSFADNITTASHVDTRLIDPFVSFTGFVQFGVGSTELRWSLPGIALPNVGAEFTLDPSTAATYGADWEAFNDFLLNSAGGEFPFSVGSIVGGVEHLSTRDVAGPPTADGAALTSLTFNILDWQPNRLTVGGIVRYSTPLPEPATLAIFAIGCAAICYRRRSWVPRSN